MLSRHAVALWSNLALLSFFCETTVWRLRNLDDYVRFVALITLGLPHVICGILIVLISIVEIASTLAFIRTKDGRPAAALLVASQMGEYALFREVNGCIVTAVLLSTLKLSEKLERSNQSVSSSALVTCEQVLRSKATHWHVAPLLLVAVMFECLGIMLRLGDDGYKAALAHDRTSFSLGTIALALSSASFDEEPNRHMQIVVDRLEDARPSAGAFVSKVRGSILVGRIKARSIVSRAKDRARALRGGEKRSPYKRL